MVRAAVDSRSTGVHRHGHWGCDVWAQLMSIRAKPGREGDLAGALDQLRSFEQPDSGLVRTTLLQDQRDPTRLYTLVVFESEAKARARESDPRRAEGLEAVRASLGEILDGPPEFVDLNVVVELAAD